MLHLGCVLSGARRLAQVKRAGGFAPEDTGNTEKCPADDCLTFLPTVLYFYCKFVLSLEVLLIHEEETRERLRDDHHDDERYTEDQSTCCLTRLRALGGGGLLLLHLAGSVPSGATARH